MDSTITVRHEFKGIENMNLLGFELVVDTEDLKSNPKVSLIVPAL
jgi:hypothetical protein